MKARSCIARIIWCVKMIWIFTLLFPCLLNPTFPCRPICVLYIHNLRLDLASIAPVAFPPWLFRTIVLQSCSPKPRGLVKSMWYRCVGWLLALTSMGPHLLKKIKEPLHVSLQLILYTDRRLCRFLQGKFFRWPSAEKECLQNRESRYSNNNTWHTMFDESTTRPGVGARMPFCETWEHHFGRRFWVFFFRNRQQK